MNTSTNDTIASIATNLTESSFNTSTYNNKWGFKPNKYVSNNTVINNTGDNSVYLPSPTTSGIVLDHTSGANSAANNYTIALGVRADSNTKSGSYAKTFNLVATANPTTYIINYNQNTTDTVSNLPSTSTTGSASSTTITLPNTVPQRTHYTFLGWCSTTTTTTNGVDSCSGTVYNPNGAGNNLTYGLDQTTANTTTLYAMWELEKFTITLATTGGANGIVIDGVNYTSSVSLAYGSIHTISGSYASGYEFSSWSASGSISVASTSSASTTLTVTGAGTLTLNGKSSMPSLALQDVTDSICPTTPTLVYDNRDNEIYTIQKLIDGKCWILDNLRLDLTNTTVINSLTSSNTNASNTTLNYLKNGGGTISDRYAITGLTKSNWTSGFSYSTPLVNTAYKNTSQSYGDGTNKIGVYYNFCAASAGSYCYGNGSNWGSPSGDATEDICPFGWRIPSVNSREYETLYNAHFNGGGAIHYYEDDGSTLHLFHNNIASTPFRNNFHATLSGYFGDNSVYDRGSWGYFWSSTRGGNWRMYGLSTGVANWNSYYPYNIYFDASLGRKWGQSVRCVLDSSFNYVVSYDKNTTAAVTNMPTSTQSGTTNSVKPVALLDNIPSRSGNYIFSSWCDTRPTTSNGIDSCPGNTVQPGGTITMSAGASSVTLYAMWVPYSSVMQNVSLSTCPTTPTQVVDSRDGEVYTIQKLADGKCWLLDNLRLDLMSVPLSILQGRTNASNSSLGYLKNGGGGISDQYAITSLAVMGGAANGSYSDPQIKTSYKNSIHSGTAEGVSGKVGVYYNFCAASAGSYCYGNGNDPGLSSGDATEDVCPAGWRMPTGGSSGEYQALYAAYSNNDTAFRSALRTIMTSYIPYDSYRNPEYYADDYPYERAYIWSSTRWDNGNDVPNRHMGILMDDDSGGWGVNTTYSDMRPFGFSVRCVLK